MARYTAEKILSFGDTQDSRLIIASGNVTINVWDGNSWVLADNLTTGNYEYFTRNTRLQLIPSGGASFFIDESGDL